MTKKIIIQGRARKLTRAKSSAGYPFYRFNVPRSIGDRIPEEAEFMPRVVPEGILFQVVNPHQVCSWMDRRPDTPKIIPDGDEFVIDATGAIHIEAGENGIGFTADELAWLNQEAVEALPPKDPEAEAETETKTPGDDWGWD